MPSKISFSSREQCLRWGRNALIVLLGGVMLIDGCPFTPESLREGAAPVVYGLGMHQTHWHLFSPIPDQVNHRLHARLTYGDGTTAEWTSLDFRPLSDWQHARYHRVGKYYDNIRDPGYATAWPGLTEHVLRDVAVRDSRAERPAKFELRVWEGRVPDARYYPWSPASERTELTNRWTLYETEAP